MEINEIILRLEYEWDDEGFLGRLREAIFNESQANVFLDLLSRISLESNVIPFRLVSLLWYLPNFLMWQKERLEESNQVDSVRYERFINDVNNVLESILGVP